MMTERLPPERRTQEPSPLFPNDPLPPLVYTGCERAEGNEWFYNTLQTRQMILDTTDCSIPTNVALDYLFEAQGKIASDVAAAIIGGMQEACSLWGSGALTDQGGGTRRLTTVSGHPFANEQVFRTFYRWEGNDLQENPYASHIPDYEKHAQEAVRHIGTYGSNLDLYGPVPEGAFPIVTGCISDTVQAFFRRKHIPFSTHQHDEGIAIEAMLKEAQGTHRVFGWKRRGQRNGPQYSEPSVFTFAPEQETNLYSVRIGVFWPVSNTHGFSNVRIAFGPMADGRFTDTSNIFLNAIPGEEGQPRKDQRYGCTDTRQATHHITLLPDGTTLLPDSREYYEHEARLTPDTWGRIKDDINSLATFLSRLVRYGVDTAVFPVRRNRHAFPHAHDQTRSDLRTVLARMIDLSHQGQVIAPEKNVEMLADFIISAHNNSHLTAAAIEMAKPREPYELTDSFAHLCIARYADCFCQIDTPSGHGTALVMEHDGRIRWGSDISNFLYRCNAGLQKAFYESALFGYFKNPRCLTPIPIGSPLAQLAWMFDPFPTDFGPDTITPELARDCTIYPLARLFDERT